MASKTSSEQSTKELEELLDTVDMTMDRLKTLYEQYFLGIQKQAPSFIHNDVERKLRDLTQMNMRNTGLRYRLATLTQKFGSYNSYWRRTLRQIENGTYGRNLAKIGRDAARTGSDIPEEILAKMPKRMREQVLRDRDAAIAIAKRRNQVEEGEAGTAPDMPAELEDNTAAKIGEPSVVRREVNKTASGAHVLSADDDDLDFDSLFAAFSDDDAPKLEKPKPKPEPKPEPRPDPTSQEITRPVPKAPMPGGAPPPGMTMRTPAPATTQPTTAIPRIPAAVADPASPTSQLPRIADPNAPTMAIPKIPPPAPTGAIPRVPAPTTTSVPKIPVPGVTQAIPRPPPPAPRPTPSGVTPPPAPRPTATGATPPPAPRPTPTGVKPPAPAGSMRPPPGMTEADVNALHAKYVKAKESVGEKVDASSREKLLRTINQTAPKIMEQYKASGVDFTVVVKDNQVVIKAKPKT